MKYKVNVDHLVGVEQGDIITADDLPEGTNVEALAQSGALSAQPDPKPKKSAKKGDQ